ncbi:hypothetical protein LWI28_004244 [Acer negundo]|uniref:Uncharacterized protein n=1 Tax=Acer negundo TaxID=4023 RepID=A0AAD5ILI0_ACENE|nr:hypothetical protein LWI28_004244 [Acer negundo]
MGDRYPIPNPVPNPIPNPKPEQGGANVANERILQDYLRPMVDINLSSIQRPTTNANNFEIKPSLIQMIAAAIQFASYAHKDPNEPTCFVLTMPRASKKKSSKDATTNESSIGVRHLGYVHWLENNLAMDYKEFEKGTPVKVKGVDVGFSAQDINMQAIIRAGNVDNLVSPFPALITYFCEQVGLEPEDGDRIAQMDEPLNSRTFNDISAQRHEVGLQPVATRKRQMRDATAEEADATAAADENPCAVPAGDCRPDWVDELLQRPT